MMSSLDKSETSVRRTSSRSPDSPSHSLRSPLLSPSKGFPGPSPSSPKIARPRHPYPIVPSSFLSRRYSPKNHHEQHRSTCITKCVLVLLFLIIGAYGLVLNFALDFTNLMEDQTCSVKRWQYPTCRSPGSTITQTIPTPGDWQEIRQAYRMAVVNEQDFSLEPSEWNNGSATGFYVPVEARYSPERGRGLYATAAVPKGTKIWDNRYTARIRSECEGRRFVQALTNDQACNVAMWGYVTDHGTGKLEWGIDLDPCSFTNQADTAAQLNVEDRIVDPSKATQPGGHSTWSTRDISAGEEILSSYDGLRDFNPSKNLFWQVKLVIKSWGFGFLY